MGFCEGKFFDYNETWNSTDLRFSECFQWSALYAGPALLLWLFAPFHLMILSMNRSAPNLFTPLYAVRLVLVFIISATYVVNLITASSHESSLGHVPDVYYVGPTVNVGSMVFLVVIMEIERGWGKQPSGLLFIYWLIQSVASTLVLYNVASDIRSTGWSTYTADLVTFFVATVCTFIQFALVFIPDKPSPNAAEAVDPKSNPEWRMTFPLRVTFFWLYRLVIMGFRRPLKQIDLYTARPGDKAHLLEREFVKHWKKELMKGNVRLPKAYMTVENETLILSEHSVLIDEKTKKKSYGKSDSSERGYQRSKSDSSERGYQRSQTHELPSVEVAQVLGKPYGPSLFKATIKYMMPTLLGASFYQVMYLVFIHMNPLVLNLLITFTGDSNEQLWHGYIYAVLFFVCGVGKALSVHTGYYICQSLGLRLRSSLMAIVYNKSVRLGSTSRQGTSVGEIVNLMSVDSQRFYDISPFFTLMWSNVVQLIIEVVMLWQILGSAVLSGLAVMILMMPISGVLAVMSRKLYAQQMRQKDKRLKIENEMLVGMKVLKLYGWEMPFLSRINGIREHELKVLFKASVLRAISMVIWNIAPFLVNLLSFMTFVLQGNNLTPQIAFVSLSLFNLLKMPLIILPMLISFLTQAEVSLKRLQKFLLLKEQAEDNISHNPRPGIALSIENGAFSWNSDDGITLEDINVKIPEGALVGVVGTVGAGKSSFVSAMLGDMERVSGRVEVVDSVAYVSQQPFVLNDTLQNNILFNSAFDKTKYMNIIEACALVPDLELLKGGDQTEIGEKGINLSGGQRQRVSLARAAYSNKNLYIFDDPLSAVDAHVGKHIFDKVIGSEGMLKSSTRILVTHGIQYLPHCDLILVISGGRITETGSYDDLIENGNMFANLIKTFAVKRIDESSDDDNDDDIHPDTFSIHDDILSEISDSEGDKVVIGLREDAPPGLVRKRIRRMRSRESAGGSISGLSGDERVPRKRTSSRKLSRRMSWQDPVKQGDVYFKDQLQQTKDKALQMNSKITVEERMEEGEVKGTVYLEYMRAIGLSLSLLMIVCFILQSVFLSVGDFWLSEWTNSIPSTGLQPAEERNLYLGIYALFGILNGIFTLIAQVCLAKASINGSRNMHKRLLNNILRSPMTFFETNPLGRILNRFGKDTDTIDVVIPFNVSFFLSQIVVVVIINVVIIVATPIYVVVMIPLAILYYIVLKFYISTNRQLKRLESVARSPIFMHFQQTINGLSTIRAYGMTDKFIRINYDRIDVNLQSYYLVVATYRWLGVLLEIIAALVVFSSAMLAVMGKASGTIDAGTVGFSVSYALNITFSLTMLVTQYGELEANIVAVERIKEYCETPNEAPWLIDQNRPETGWPKTGSITFNEYSTRYRDDLDLVLRKLTCSINDCEKIGIVGRTGAGKSSLTQSLFRIIEAVYGSIVIDGMNIAKIGLHDLRTRITIIPQEPLIFSGTLRFNLDPFDEHTDADVWKVLSHAHLKAFVETLAGGLQFECVEDGENLSVGQRQLICLARALLRHTKIIVLDEATAAVDMDTDSLIQSTIRDEFSDCTVLTIAHRLNTIMDSTRIMVLDAGTIAEFDTPRNLLQSKGMFYGMAKEAGLVK